MSKALASVEEPLAQARKAHERLLKIDQEMNLKWLRRSAFIRGALIALLSRQHAIVLGPPGEAKSAIIDDLRKRITGAKSFKYVVNKYTIPDEIFGPVDLIALKDRKLQRVTTNYISEAHIAFIDEVGKASGSLPNTMLQLMNEREVLLNGQIFPGVLVSLFGASNEALDKKELGAFWDRFQLRYEIEGLRGPDLRRFLEAEATGRYLEESGAGATITLEELATLQRLALPGPNGVQITNRCYTLYEDILHQLKAKGLPLPSTRRSSWNMLVLRASAVLHGRMKTVETDLTPLADTLWDTPKDRKEVNALVLKLAHPRLHKAQELYDSIVNVEATVLEFWGDPKNSGAKAAKAREAIEARSKVSDQAVEMRALYDDAKAEGADTAELATLLRQAGQVWDNLNHLSEVGGHRNFMQGVQGTQGTQGVQGTQTPA